ncbi:MAG: hypothetical protein AABZ60_24585 [Planctomycetota bacterium]
MNELSLHVANDLSLGEKDFFESISRQIMKMERSIPFKSKRSYRLEVSKKAQEYILRLMDVKADREIDKIRIQSSAALLELETRLLTELTQTIEKYTMQAALDIQKDYQQAKELALKIDPEDKEFAEDILKDIRNTALGNLKDVSRLKDRNRF